jgi:dipeptidyl aminopeptidase/acylaminoacyl peptidase
MRVIATGLIAAFVLATPALAQQSVAKKKMTLRDTYLDPGYGGYQLSPDGGKVLFVRSERDTADWSSTGHVWLYDLGSNKSWQLTSAPKGENGARWLKDGRVVFSSNRDTKNQLWVITPGMGEATRLIENDSGPSNGSFSPDEMRIAFTERTERPDKKVWDQKVKKKDDGYFFEKPLGYTQVWVWDLAAGKKKQITSGDWDNQGTTWSPDGKWIAFTSNRSGTTVRDANWSGNSDIFVVPADSGAERQLTNEPGPDRSPAFSPDGTRIAYLSSDNVNNSADQMDVKVMPVGGGKPVNLTSDFDYSVGDVEWSKDGKTIWFTAAEGLGTNLYRVAATGGKPAKVSFGDDFVLGNFQRSEDGSKWLVTGGTLMQPAMVLLTDAQGAKPRRILEEHDRVDGYALAKAEAITWKGADSWDIEGVLTYPLDYVPGQRYPMILQIHGGPHGRYSANFNQSAQIWAARGYAVLQGNPRGSSGRTFEFSNANTLDWGGKDYEDLMKGVDFVIAKGVADPDRMGVMGGSYGGFMTFWTVTQTDRFKAAIGHAGISDWYSFFGQTDIPNLLEFGFGGLPAQTKEVYEKWSPIEYASNVKTPLLITHGENDTRVPIPQADEYYRLLKKLDKTVEFLRYPREGHGIGEPMHRLHLEKEQEAWFAKYVLRQTATPVSDAGR